MIEMIQILQSVWHRATLASKGEDSTNVACPRCRYELVASPQLVGQRFVCPACGQPMLMPQIEEEEETEEPPIIQVRRTRSAYTPPQRSPGIEPPVVSVASYKPTTVRHRKQTDNTILLASLVVAVAAVVAVSALFHVYVDEPLRKTQIDAEQNAKEAQEILEELHRQQEELLRKR